MSSLAHFCPVDLVTGSTLPSVNWVTLRKMPTLLAAHSSSDHGSGVSCPVARWHQSHFSDEEAKAHEPKSCGLSY